MARFAAVAAIAGSENEPDETSPDDSRQAGPEPDSLSDPKSRPRLLVVEDDYLVSLTICDLLDSKGYTVLGPAITGEEAVELALAERPSLVLMDISLAGEMDGVEAAVALARAGIPCLFVSAHSDPKTRVRGAAASPKGWVEKPFSDVQLLQAVASALE